MLVKIEGRVEWKYAIDPASGAYMGICPALNLNAIGDTWEELAECANETTGLLMSALLERGEFDAFLRQHGWKAQSPTPLRQDTAVRFDIPLGLVQTASPRELMAS